jgi:hypothetical protein
LTTIREQDLPEFFWRPDLYGTEGEIGRSLQLGDEAIRKGDLRKAKTHFEAAEQMIRDVGYDAHLKQHRDLALDRLDLVVNAQRLRDDVDAWRRLVQPNNVTEDITTDTADEVLAKFDAGDRQEVADSANELFLVYDDAGNAYYVKQIPPENADPTMAKEILAAEAASCDLARRVDEIERQAAGAGPEYAGVSAPAARYDEARGLLITRAIPRADEFRGQPEFVTLALKREYAKQRLFRAWVGDTDGHLRNILLGEDGRVYMIDFDMAILTGAFNRQITHDVRATPGEMVQRTVTVWAEPDIRGRFHLYQWMARLDQTISYDDVQPTVQAIQALASAGPPEDPTRVLRELLENAGYPNPEGAARNLKERAEELDTVARQLFDGGLLNRATSALRLTTGDWLASFPVLLPPVPSSAGVIRGPSCWFGGAAAVIPRADEMRRAA